MPPSEPAPDTGRPSAGAPSAGRPSAGGASAGRADDRAGGPVGSGDHTEITTREELLGLIGQPNPAVFSKASQVLREFEREWIRHAPLCFIATAASDGTCDVSPKGTRRASSMYSTTRPSRSPTGRATAGSTAGSTSCRTRMWG